MAHDRIRDAHEDLADGPMISVVIPCLNEVASVAACVEKGIEKTGLAGEVVVSDNGSTDGSGELARAAGARVVDESRLRLRLSARLQRRALSERGKSETGSGTAER